MSLTFIPNTAPSYIALSTDISGSKIDGANYIGASVYITDTGKIYIVMPDLTLEEVAGGGTTSISGSIMVGNFPEEYPVSGSVVLMGGSASIGSVLIEEMPIGGYAYGSEFVSGVTGSIIDNTPTEVVTSAGSALGIYLTTIMVTNSGVAGTNIDISSGSAGASMWGGYAGADSGGFAVSLPAPLKFDQGEGVFITCEEISDISVVASAAGYKA